MYNPNNKNMKNNFYNKMINGSCYVRNFMVWRKNLRKTLIILLLSCITLAGLPQTVTYQGKNLSLETVFDVIKEQTGYVFFYNYKFLNKADRIDIDVKDASVEDVIKTCLADQSLNYYIEDKTVVIIEDTGASSSEALEEAVLIDVKGKVSAKNGDVLPGATIRIKGTTKGTVTNKSGEFSLFQIEEGVKIIISFIGYQTKEVEVKGDTFLNVVLVPEATELEGIAIYSTGYQSVPKERATGSFEKIDARMFNSRSGDNIINRLEGMVPGLLFDQRTQRVGEGGFTNVTIRGPSDLGSSPREVNRPLVVVDNIEYEGDIRDINTNDVEDITFLKDAAATSIWGVRAGNGVIVITTKKGTYKKDLTVNVHTNFSISDKPDLNYSYGQYLNSSDFIDMEMMLYDLGRYNSDISDTWLGGDPLSPVVQILEKKKAGDLTDSEANAQIDLLRGYSFHKDLLKYVYKKRVLQQYAFDISKGTDKLSYFFSTGYDKNSGDYKGTEDERITVNSKVKLKPLKNLEVSTNFYFSRRKHIQGNRVFTSAGKETGKSGYYPYARLADNQGNPLTLVQNFRISWAEIEGQLRGLDWTYVPLNDLNKQEFTSKDWQVLLDFGASYQISPALKAEVLYQYQKANGESKQLWLQESYYVRDLVNRFTEITASNIIRHLPLGDVVQFSNSAITSNTIRAQLNYDKTWSNKHQFSAILGGEIRETISESKLPLIIYGYNDDNLSSQVLDFNQSYMNYNLSYYQTPFPFNPYSFTENTTRLPSIYTNMSYTYDYKYTLTFSARKDGANLYGVKSNQKFNPNWSAGFSWNISNEEFYKATWLPYLKFRATYGFAGNMNSSLSAKTTLKHRGNHYQTGRPYATINNLPNADLTWMKVRTTNLGLDFTFKNNRLSGSIEYYNKKTSRIYSPIELDPTTGKGLQVVNDGELKGNGIDITLNSKNIIKKNFEWSSSFIFSYETNEVVKYDGPVYPSSLPGFGTGVNPIIGNNLYGLYSFNFAGLDEEGNPLGYDENGELTSTHSWNTYTLSPDTVTELVYHGSARPTYYGALRNTVKWKGFELYFNITFRMGYYFRKNTVNYSGLENQWGDIHTDILDRWQNPGDEDVTSIPAMPENLSDWKLRYRDKFYAYSSATVAKADNIRLQDINLSYTFSKPDWYIQNLRVYVNISNIGILWRANDWNLDPDFGPTSYPTPHMITFGLTANF